MENSDTEIFKADNSTLTNNQLLRKYELAFNFVKP